MVEPRSVGQFGVEEEELGGVVLPFGDALGEGGGVDGSGAVAEHGLHVPSAVADLAEPPVEVRAAVAGNVRVG
ncbi:hypothetical protein GCM10020000_52620 [Streptomyces olivoverticillatus]